MFTKIFVFGSSRFGKISANFFFRKHFRKHFRIIGLPPLDVYVRVHHVPLISNACNVLGFLLRHNSSHVMGLISLVHGAACRTRHSHYYTATP